MKRLLILIGMLILPMTVQAQALSPWVQGVLDRAEAGILLANSLPETSCNPESIQSEILNNQDEIRKQVIPAMQREAEIASLRESTVCFQSDKHLLELKIRQVQDAMDTALQGCKISTSQALRENYKFLMGAYYSFVQGGTNPSFRDDRLRFRYPFHDADLLTAGARDPVPEIGSTAPLCPYTTDYGAHSIGFIPTPVGAGAAAGGPAFDIRSFGCDRDVLQTIPDPFDDEALRLWDFMTRTEMFSTSIYNTVSATLFNLDTVIGVLTGAIPRAQAPGAKLPPPHAEQTGCLKPLPPDFDVDSPAEINALLTTYPDYFESYNLRDDGSGTPTYNPLPEETLPTGMLHLPVIDYFLSVPNAGIITRSYVDLREKAGGGRPLPDYFLGTMYDSFIGVIMRSVDAATKLQGISANIEREMGIFESGNTDALERMQDSSVPLEAAIQSLVNIVETELPEKYIPELTLFLARSCVDGHCQRTLDAVARRTFNPYCHPYVSGRYTEDDAAKYCFCDPVIEFRNNEFWKQYCSADFGEDMARYDAMDAKMIPACVEESPVISSGSVI